MIGLCLTPAVRAADPLDFLSLIPIDDGNPATNDFGWANSYINATSFRNQSLITVGDYQFTSYYGADQRLIIGRRDLSNPGAAWHLHRTEFTSFNINDAHNVSSIGIDGDGYLHVAWGVHNNPLQYTRSTTSVVHGGDIELVGDTVGNSGMLADQIPLQSNAITYPEFWNSPEGDLLLTYRTGSSGNGEYQLARWNNSVDDWSGVHAVQNSGNSNTSPQPWIDNDFSSTQSPPNASAYHNGLVYDSTGRLHTTWTWRTGGDSTSGFTDYQSNHNLMYAYSDNGGVDWYKADGTRYERNGWHDIDENNAAPVVSIPAGSSLINSTSSTIGPNDRLYVATWYAPEAAQGNHTRQYMLVEFGGADWQTHQISDRSSENNNNRMPESQLRNFWMARPVVLTDENNRVFVVMGDTQRGQGVTVAYSENAARDDWQFIDLVSDHNLANWEPKIDQLRWDRDGVLSMYYQSVGLGQSPTPAYVLEWDALSYFQQAPEPSAGCLFAASLAFACLKRRRKAIESFPRRSATDLP